MARTQAQPWAKLGLGWGSRMEDPYSQAVSYPEKLYSKSVSGESRGCRKPMKKGVDTRDVGSKKQTGVRVPSLA